MICPFCKNDALEEKQEFCYECGSCGLTLRAETSSSSHQLEKTEDRDQTTQASDVRIDSTEGLHGKIFVSSWIQLHILERVFTAVRLEKAKV